MYRDNRLIHKPCTLKRNTRHRPRPRSVLGPCTCITTLVAHLTFLSRRESYRWRWRDMECEGIEWDIQIMSVRARYAQSSFSSSEEVDKVSWRKEGGKFSPHTDGRRLESVNDQSFMTINIYLETVPESHGGATRFLSPGKEVIKKVQPQLGQCVKWLD
jgi:hypothetical protein